MIKVFMYIFAKPMFIKDAELKPDRVYKEDLVFSIHSGGRCIGNLVMPLEDLKGCCVDFSNLFLFDVLGLDGMHELNKYCANGWKAMGFSKKVCAECEGTGYVSDHLGPFPCYYCNGKGVRYYVEKEAEYGNR